MKRNSRICGGFVLATTLVIGSFLMATAQAQTTFTGKFTLTSQVQWGRALLRPGDYTITVESTTSPVRTLIRDSRGRAVGWVISGIYAGEADGGNALHLYPKRGQLHVYSLALTSLGSVLVYDPSLAREAVLEALAPQTVPVILAKR
jgi:hypothetical protein